MPNFDEPRSSSSIRFYRRWFWAWAITFALMIASTTFFSYVEKYGYAMVQMVYAIIATQSMGCAARSHDRLVRERDSGSKNDSYGGA